MLEALATFTASPHPLGGENLLEWILPTILPDSYALLIFRRLSRYVTDSEINAYIDTTTTASGMTVLEIEIPTSNQYHDFAVTNANVYYYSAIIHDIDSDEISAVQQDTATPGFSATLDVVNWKEKLCDAIEKIMLNYSMTNRKDYLLHKAYSFEKPNIPIIVVVRQGASDVQRMFGNIMQDTIDEMKFGKFENENFVVTWADHLADRRDKLTLLLKAHEQTIRRFLVQDGAIEIRIEMGSDDIDARWEESILHTCQMLVSIVHTPSITFADQDLRLGFSDVIHTVTGSDPEGDTESWDYVDDIDEISEETIF